MARKLSFKVARKQKNTKNIHCTKPAFNAPHRPWVVSISYSGHIFTAYCQQMHWIMRCCFLWIITGEKKNVLLWAGRDSGDSWSASYSPVNQNLKLGSRGVEVAGVSGVTGSAELNHVESACGENPNISPLTPGRPVRPAAQTEALTHRPQPVPTFRLFEVEPARPITDWTWGQWGWQSWGWESGWGVGVGVGVVNRWKH